MLSRSPRGHDLLPRRRESMSGSRPAAAKARYRTSPPIARYAKISDGSELEIQPGHEQPLAVAPLEEVL